MFEVLAFVYENYWGGDSCPELPALQRKLNAVGFDDGEVIQALLWLEDLKSATRELPPARAIAAPDTSGTTALRVLTQAEQTHLGSAAWGFLIFLVSAGVLPPERLELVMDRMMAAPGAPVSVIDLKLIVLMVFWSLGEKPDALMLDELCDHQEARLAH